MPLFFMSFFKMPKGISSLCKKIQMQFLWGREENEKKTAWVKWSHVCGPREEGGLGGERFGLVQHFFISKMEMEIAQRINRVMEQGVAGEIWKPRLD